VGGGAAGALVAINLLKQFRTGDEVIVFEPSLAVGRGVPYGTSDPVHLLNVRAANMSGFVDQPAHFAEWYARRIGVPVAEASTRFVPRCEYGVYVGELLEQAAENSEGQLTIVRQRAERVVAAEHIEVETSNGTLIALDELVLATGHLSPQTPRELLPFEHNDRYLRNPWTPGALEAIPPDDTILILGTGLTMVDVVMSLTSRGHRGMLIARSRRGLVPHQHVAGETRTFDESVLAEPHFKSAIIRQLRAAGADWRAVMDSMRPHTQLLWDRLSWPERRRFIEKLRPFWDVHRHRIPQSAYEILAMLVERGRLDVGKGRLEDVSFADGEFCVRSNGETIAAGWILNCTGPNLQVAKAKISVLESVVSQDLASYDPLGLGLLVDSDGRTRPGGHVWALGPLCRGSRWETTAIPEIRAQAARIAALI
jgi:uncharacterized NAD(P)/FAD-binding protein YdhS